MDIVDIKELIQKATVDYKKDIESLDPDKFYSQYLSKKGKINDLFALIRDKSKDEKLQVAIELNKLKSDIISEFEKVKSQHQDDTQTNLDLTLPVNPTMIGNLHPITSVTRELNQFFHYYGFSVFDGPEIESDFYNFEMMGVPSDHPARELQDTLYIMEPDFLLRTQTSSIEARELTKQRPPIRFVFGGKVFRNETANKSNGSLFHQFQGVCIDNDITLSNLKWIFEKSLKFILGPDTEIRFRAKYYPEVEPGLSPDIKCTFCKGEGCEICKYRGWIEIAGGGMIHPKTLEYAKINPNEFTGFAFGWGLDRIAMARYNIRDLRLLFNGNIVYK